MAFYSAHILARTLDVRLWPDSPFVCRQFKRIGPMLSNHLAKAGIKTITAIIKTDPRDIERIVGRPPPFGNELIAEAERLPQYELVLDVNEPELQVMVTIRQTNKKSDRNLTGKLVLFVGDDENSTVLVKKDL